MSERTAVYRMFGADDALLYIGMTKNFGQRWQSESSQMPWWPEVTRQTVEWFPSREAAHEAELAAIGDEHPRYNVAGLPVQFRQPRPPRPSLPVPPTWTDTGREQAISQIRELLMRPDLSHAAVRLMAANLLSTGSADLPRGAQLAMLARCCGVSRSMAFNILAASDDIKAAG